MSDTHFKIRIADVVIEIMSLYDCIHEFCIDYLTDDKPDILVKMTASDIDYERTREEKGGSGGSRIPEDYPDSYLEVLSCYRKIAEEMIDRDILLMHGSAVAIDGEGVMFAAESGTGKSTHAGLWKDHFKDRVKLINDDKPLVKLTGEGAIVCGTPWSGKKGLNTPVNVILKTIYKLERAPQSEALGCAGRCIVRNGANAVYEMSKEEKWRILASQSYKPRDPVRLSHSMMLIDRLLQMVPVRRLVCDISREAAITAYEGVGYGSIS